MNGKFPDFINYYKGLNLKNYWIDTMMLILASLLLLTPQIINLIKY